MSVDLAKIVAEALPGSTCRLEAADRNDLFDCGLFGCQYIGRLCRASARVQIHWESSPARSADIFDVQAFGVTSEERGEEWAQEGTLVRMSGFAGSGRFRVVPKGQTLMMSSDSGRLADRAVLWITAGLVGTVVLATSGFTLFALGFVPAVVVAGFWAAVIGVAHFVSSGVEEKSAERNRQVASALGLDDERLKDLTFGGDVEAPGFGDLVALSLALSERLPGNDFLLGRVESDLFALIPARTIVAGSLTVTEAGKEQHARQTLELVVALVDVIAGGVPAADEGPASGSLVK